MKSVRYYFGIFLILHTPYIYYGQTSVYLFGVWGALYSQGIELYLILQ